MKVLVTCPPMLGMKDHFIPILSSKGFDTFCPDVTQTLSEQELIKLVPKFDGWIIGDDPVTREVLLAGLAGQLKAAVKWGIGTDNIDYAACTDLGLDIPNTPGMFGSEVSDLAISYMISLARETYFIDREIRKGSWPKNRGISLKDKTVGVVGYGDIGKKVVQKSLCLDLNVIVYDPFISLDSQKKIKSYLWPNNIDKCDFIIFTCALNESNKYMFREKVIQKCKKGVRIINVARGQLINEKDLCFGLENKTIHSAALDVFEKEPLPASSYLRKHPLCILGSHNASNTEDAVVRTNELAINKLEEMLSE